MQQEQNSLLKELLLLTDRAIASTKKFKYLSESDLNFKKDSSQWSILECLEHLNLYGEFYLPEIEKKQSGKNEISNPIFKSGIIGNYFVSLIKVDNGKIKKMKAPKDKNPINSNLTTNTIDNFLSQSERLRALLLQSKKSDLTKTKTAISLTRFIKLRLGDTLRFVVYHNERHIIQAENLLKDIKLKG